MTIYVIGTFDTKGLELNYISDLIKRTGTSTLLVDVSTLVNSKNVDVNSQIVANHHPNRAVNVFDDDRGKAITQMSIALKHFISSRTDIEGIISAGGSGGTELVTAAMRTLPVGIPKVMISTVASGNVQPYVGPNDICMIYSITDIQGLNRISRKVLGNGAHAIAGMVKSCIPKVKNKPAIGLSMFGVTTPCIQAVVKELESDFDCIVFHATGTGGQSMEKLVESGFVKGLIDATTTEICDLLMGGVFSAGEDRLNSIIRTKLPYVGSCGALDMVNFGAKESVPQKYKERKLHSHNSNVTLMRTTIEENKYIGQWIADKLNQMKGEVRFLLPLKGLSSLDSEGQVFYNPRADAALFDAIENNVMQTEKRKLIKLNHNINDPEFSKELVKQFKKII
ncbi:MAG: Tm-1-like ATP-binding domain-containing protein [Alphaproteobacteria bacterium]